MIYDEDPSRCRPGEINGNMKLTGEVRLDDGNYRKMAFRTPLSRQNWRCRVVGENNFLGNGVILYNSADCKNYMGNVGWYDDRQMWQSMDYTSALDIACV